MIVDNTKINNREPRTNIQKHKFQQSIKGPILYTSQTKSKFLHLVTTIEKINNFNLIDELQFEISWSKVEFLVVFLLRCCIVANNSPLKPQL